LDCEHQQKVFVLTPFPIKIYNIIITFEMNNLFQQVWQEIIQWFKKIWFEARLTARLKMIEIENQIESEKERAERLAPVYQEKPIDPVVQTGESQLLGGEMRLAAKWVLEEESKEK